MIKKILTYPQDKEILSQISEEVDNIEEIRDLIQDMRDTMHSDLFGRGISAIQIGVPKRVCIILWNGKETVLINPVITRTRGEKIYKEGCLSAPGIFKDIKRAQKVWCPYLDVNGQQQEIAEGGRASDIIQHELDHFEGKCQVYL